MTHGGRTGGALEQVTSRHARPTVIH
jgi:hypothetical protein